MLNKFFTIGRLCKSNELKAMANGTFVLENDLAFDSLSKDKQGKYETNFIKVVFYGKGAENVAKYTDKGSLIQIEGWLKQKNHTLTDGRKITYYSVVVSSYSLLGSKKAESASLKEEVYKEPSMEELNAVPLADEELPF